MYLNKTWKSTNISECHQSEMQNKLKTERKLLNLMILND